MLGPSLILWMFVLPPTVAGIALMLGAGGPGRGGQGEPRRRFGTLGCGLGLLIGYWGLLGQLPGLPPHDANGALFYVFLGSTLAAWFEGGARSSPLVRLPLRVLAARAHVGPADLEPGIVVRPPEGGVRVATGDGWLALHEVQRAGGKAMEIDAFLRGRDVPEGTRLGAEARRETPRDETRSEGDAR